MKKKLLLVFGVMGALCALAFLGASRQASAEFLGLRDVPNIPIARGITIGESIILHSSQGASDAGALLPGATSSAISITIRNRGIEAQQAEVAVKFLRDGKVVQGEQVRGVQLVLEQEGGTALSPQLTLPSQDTKVRAYLKILPGADPVVVDEVILELRRKRQAEPIAVIPIAKKLEVLESLLHEKLPTPLAGDVVYGVPNDDFLILINNAKIDQRVELGFTFFASGKSVDWRRAKDEVAIHVRTTAGEEFDFQPGRCIVIPASGRIFVNYAITFFPGLRFQGKDVNIDLRPKACLG